MRSNEHVAGLPPMLTLNAREPVRKTAAHVRALLTVYREVVVFAGKHRDAPRRLRKVEEALAEEFECELDRELGPARLWVGRRHTCTVTLKLVDGRLETVAEAKSPVCVVCTLDRR